MWDSHNPFFIRSTIPTMKETKREIAQSIRSQSLFHQVNDSYSACASLPELEKAYVTIPFSSGQRFLHMFSSYDWCIDYHKSQSLFHQVNDSYINNILSVLKNQDYSHNPFFIRSTIPTHLLEDL